MDCNRRRWCLSRKKRVYAIFLLEVKATNLHWSRNLLFQPLHFVFLLEQSIILPDD
jgi:hypothetical protein